MNFVTFETAGEALFFSKELPGYNAWIGISDQLVEEKFVNYYDSSRDVTSLVNWIAGQRNNGPNLNEDCIYVNAAALGHNDYLCITFFKAACMSKFDF